MLRLFVFGGLRLEDSRDRLSAPAVRRRSLALLALVAAAGPRGVTRERLLGILWPERPEEQGRHALAQALYALRKEIGGLDPFETVGAALRLNADVLESDVGDFLRAVEGRAWRAALDAYGGPLLEGFYLPQAEAFEQWVEGERGRFATLHRTALEHEAEALERAGDARGAARWWREITQLDPLAAAPRIRLMQALAAAGERSAALDEARRHRDALAAELGVGPDAGVAALERSLTAATPPAAASPLSDRAAMVVAPAPNAPAPRPAATHARQQRRRGVLALLILTAALLVAFLARREAGDPPVVAVGIVESHLRRDTTGIARSLGDLIATHLVQVPRLRVVGRARLLEVLGEDAERPGPGVLARAARTAGADELIEGVLYADPAGYRLDLRSTRLADGEVREAVTATARDPVQLVESAVAALAGRWNLQAPTTPLRSVTSVSLTARRFLDEGLRAYFSGDQRSALGLFRLALAEDTTFAMAAYYLARNERSNPGPAWERAMRLAERATDRERLLILASGALEMNDAQGLAYAETLSVRYPDDLDGIRVLGDLRLTNGDFNAAAAAFDRVIALDSAGRTGSVAHCHACEAAAQGIWAALAGDSLARAERLARAMAEWPGGRVSSPALLATVLLRQGRTSEAVAAAREAARSEPSVSAEAVELDALLREGEVARVDSLMSLRLASTQFPETRSPILERLSRTRREGGRPRSALPLADERIRTQTEAVRTTYAFVHLERALSLLELGRHDPRRARQAAALFDSMSAMPSYAEVRMPRHRVWMWSHVATALARAGDTAALPRLEERIARMAARSSYGRDRRLRYYVRGLLEEARGNWEAARLAYTAAVWSPTENAVAPALARAALRTGRPADAIRALEAWLRGPLDASNQYAPRWEAHRLLGDAYAASGDSVRARVHHDWVRRALRNAEPEYRGILDSLR
ncbi:MAG: BTAD domain-containing putative transcriptional regulator [Gemmatimonadota bacterium]